MRIKSFALKTETGTPKIDSNFKFVLTFVLLAMLIIIPIVIPIISTASDAPAGHFSSGVEIRRWGTNRNLSSSRSVSNTWHSSAVHANASLHRTFNLDADTSGVIVVTNHNSSGMVHLTISQDDTSRTVNITGNQLVRISLSDFAPGQV